MNSMLNQPVLGTMIRRSRLIEGFTQTELARVSGLSKSYISRMERGQLFPDPQVLSRIAQPLAMEQRDLLVYAACAALNSPSEINDDILSGILEALKGLKPGEPGGCACVS